MEEKSINYKEVFEKLIREILADKNLSASKKIEALELATRVSKNLSLR